MANEITITRNDAVTLTITANKDAAGHDLTGATLETRLPGAKVGEVIVIGDDAHTLGNQNTNPGRFSVALTAAESARLRIGDNLPIITRATQGASVVHFHGAQTLRVLSDKLA